MKNRSRPVQKRGESVEDELIAIDGPYLSSSFKEEITGEAASELFKRIERSCQSQSRVFLRVEMSNAYLVYQVNWSGSETKLVDINFNMIGFPDKSEMKTDQWKNFSAND
jgi:hypothetical protein